MPENVELIDIHKREPDNYEPPLAKPDAVHCLRPDPLSSKKSAEGDLNDLEQTLASGNPLQSPLTTCEVARGPLLISIWKWALLIMAPIISIAYLAFCYVVHYRVVPVNVSGLASGLVSQVLLTNLGAGITTINIIIISLALIPLKTLLDELRSEEFFRLLSVQGGNRGVQLNAINEISTSSYGLVGSFTAIVHRHCSIYYVVAFIAMLAVWTFSSLAPAALTIQPVLVDGEIMAFPIGTIPPLALYQPVAAWETPLASSFSPAAGYSAAIVWAEREIGLSYSFSVLSDSQGTYSGFVVPTPTMLNSTTNARWLTDVIGFNPYCTWANPVNLTATSLNATMNSTRVPTNALSVHLEGLDLKVSVPSSYFPVYNSFFVTSINAHDPTVTVFNYSTGSLPTDGAMVMSVIQCASSSCTKESINIVSLFVNFTDIPSVRFSSIDVDYEIGFLVCKPNMTIETREIRTQGSMAVGVQPLATGAPPYPKLGNLDWTQTSLLVAYSMSKLTTDSGPASSAWFGLGSGTQADFMFGPKQMNSIPSHNVIYDNTTMVLTPLPTNQLAQGYTQMVKASMKPYVSGSLGTLYVPGRIASVQNIFVSSLSHVIASTVLIVFLLILAVTAHFRPGKGDYFNLTNIAAALADSDLPEAVRKAKVDVMTEREQGRRRRRQLLGNNVGQEVAERLGNWKVSMKLPGKEDGLDVLHICRK